MEIELYALDKAQYRVIEKENNSEEKFYFLQRTNYGHHYYKRHKLFFWKKELHHSELNWSYIYCDDKKGGFSDDYFNYLMTKDFRGKVTPVDLNLHLDKACKSVEEATKLMHEYIDWLNHIQKKRQEKEEEEECKKLKPEKETIIPLYDTSGKITAV